MYYCTDALDSKWVWRDDMCTDDYCTIQNKKAGAKGCLGVQGFQGKGKYSEISLKTVESP